MEKPRWVMSDRFYTGFSCKVTVSVMEQSSAHLRLKTILVALPPSSYFNHHIRNSRAWIIYQLPHHFHHLLCECFCEVCYGMMRIHIHDVHCSPPPPDVSVKMVLTVSVSTARTSKFSHLLRLADNFWWWVTIRVKQSYLELVSASVTMCLSSPPRLIPLLFFFYFKHLTTAWACYWERNTGWV